MRFIYIVLVIAAALAFRVFVYRRRQQRRAATATPADAHAERVGDVPPGPTRRSTFGDGLGDVGLVALREIRERVRGRIFRVGTIVILLAVGAAIVIPAVHKNSATQAQKVGVVVPTTADVSSVHTLIQ